MEEVQARHRKEQRDLVARITQKKKGATKKTRKGVNDECENLERELRERQALEIAALNGGGEGGETEDGGLYKPQLESEDGAAHDLGPEGQGVARDLGNLSIEPKNGSDQMEAQEVQQPKKRNRARERLARRAAEQEAQIAEAKAEAAAIPDLRELEKQSMLKQFKELGLQEKFIQPDGHCLYSAIADQLRLHEIGLKPEDDASMPQAGTEQDSTDLPAYRQVRGAAAAYIKQHPDDFTPFLEKDLDEYVSEVRDTAEWGGQVELLALARTYNIPIRVVQGNGTVEKIEGGEDVDESKTAWLAYYRHNFGLGEHYNSLWKVR